MSVRKLTANLLMALVLLAGFNSVHAQHGGHIPIATDPLAFDPDFRWFEPMTDLDFVDLKPAQRVKTGWFATYDRLYLYGSRPEVDDPNSTDRLLDSGWGNRYEVGFVMPVEEEGWIFTWTETSVGEFFTVPRERLNRFNEAQLEGEPDPAQPPFGFPVPAADGNTGGLNTRTYFIQDSDNVVDYNSYELVKTWRMEPFHYGGILEPTVGFRWMRINDLNARQLYVSALDIDQIPPGGDPPLDEFGDAEQLITDGTFTDNEILTGQVGFRYTRWRDRFRYSADFRTFMGGSLQNSKSSRLTQITIYDGTGAGSEVDNILTRQTTPIYTSNEEFSIGFDVRGELAYQLTRDVNVRIGVQVIDVAMGVWRGGSQDPSRNLLLGGDMDQDLVLVGGTFGVTLNR